MKQQIIRVGDNLRIVVEVLCNGSIKISLEQHRTSYICKNSWEPVTFRRWPFTRDGYIIRNPKQKKLKRFIRKCRKAALHIWESHNIVDNLLPLNNRDKKLKELTSDIARSVKIRLSNDLDFQFTEENKQTITRRARSAGVYITNVLLHAALSEDRREQTDIDLSKIDPNITSLVRTLIPQSATVSELEEVSDNPQTPETSIPEPINRTDELILHEDNDEEE